MNTPADLRDNLLRNAQRPDEPDGARVVFGFYALAADATAAVIRHGQRFALRLGIDGSAFDVTSSAALNDLGVAALRCVGPLPDLASCTMSDEQAEAVTTKLDALPLRLKVALTHGGALPGDVPSPIAVVGGHATAYCAPVLLAGRLCLRIIHYTADSIADIADVATDERLQSLADLAGIAELFVADAERLTRAN